MTTKKITLTNDEINEYNKLKLKIRNARTRIEISLYTKQAEDILEKGRIRYVNKLEKNNRVQIKGIELGKAREKLTKVRYVKELPHDLNSVSRKTITANVGGRTVKAKLNRSVNQKTNSSR